MVRDFRHALRTLRASPVFCATAVVTIALGIGASTAIFSVTNAVLLRPLPYKNPEQLVVMLSDLTRRGVRDLPFSAADFFDIRSGMQSSLEGVAGVYTFPYAFSARDGRPELLRSAL